MPQAADGSALAFREGRCHVVLAFDVGREVDLRAARGIVGGSGPAAETVTAAPLPAAGRSLGFVETTASLSIGRLRSAPEAAVRVFDFGAVAVTLSFPLSGTTDDVAELASALRTDESVETAAREMTERVLRRLLPAIAEPLLAEASARYDVFHLRGVAGPDAPEAVHESRPRGLVRILRPGSADPSDEEVADALRDRASRTPQEAVLLDVHSAVVFGERAEEVLAVLEFVTVQLLEMRFLDARLDEALDRSYDLLASSPWRLGLPGLHGAELDRVGRRRIDAAFLFEHVRNAPKLLDEPYLVRVYEEAAVRRRLPAWNDAIHRKIDTLGTVYERLRDRAAIVRLEVLEWIVILLIFVSIVLPFLVSSHG